MWSARALFQEALMVHVVDVGAALAEHPNYQPLIDAGAARLSGFEPTPEECEKLNAKYGAPHRIHPVFVGNGQTQTYHETNVGLTGSLFEPHNELNSKFQQLAELMQVVARHEVQTTRLDDVEGLVDVDMVKIDVQGAELQVFQHAPRVLSEAVLIQTEVEFVPLYKDQPLFADVDAHLRAAGYQLHTFLGFGSRAFKPLAKNNQPYDGFRQILWSDAVYVRDFMHLDRLADGKLKKLAVLLHDVYQSPDLCHHVLEALDRRGGGQRYAPRYLQQLTAPAPRP
ncbi:FkbM family methyltransferase [Caenimonas sedimenti]|uniref:FkbM family methyltransferase n=1 Tax=Caenimonas sedimenti TaxID=2596921 RepID=A0A562ZU57_9BURK|nr:FkbM family methyltransferase [Caenimonas sedimenti]TWO71937.1 FkbM family methyltransferase [Caenimonas sedimenti]